MSPGAPSTTGAAGAGSPASPASGTFASPAAENEALSNYLFIICGAVSIAVILWKVTDITSKFARKIACLNNDRQRYFAIASPNLSWIKRHVLYAPVFSKRHNREIQLSSAINVGTLPTRFQLLFLLAYLGTNVAFCVVDISFAADLDDVAKLVRNRTGVLATVNMVRTIVKRPPPRLLLE